MSHLDLAWIVWNIHSEVLPDYIITADSSFPVVWMRILRSSHCCFHLLNIWWIPLHRSCPGIRYPYIVSWTQSTLILSLLSIRLPLQIPGSQSVLRFCKTVLAQRYGSLVLSWRSFRERKSSLVRLQPLSFVSDLNSYRVSSHIWVSGLWRSWFPSDSLLWLAGMRRRLGCHIHLSLSLLLPRGSLLLLSGSRSRHVFSSCLCWHWPAGLPDGRCILPLVRSQCRRRSYQCLLD